MRIKNYNLLLIALNALCVFFLMQIELHCFDLFESSFKPYLAGKVNHLVANIAYSVIGSTLFYLIVVVYPEYNRRKSTYAIIQPRLKTICNSLHLGVVYLIEKRIKSKEPRMQNLNHANFEKVDRLTYQKMAFRCKIKGDHGGWIPFSMEEEKELEFFRKQKNMAINKIDEILALPTANVLDEELIEVLAKLRDSLFYSGIDAFSMAGANATVDKFSEGVYEYYTLYKKLKRYTPINEIEIIRE